MSTRTGLRRLEAGGESVRGFVHLGSLVDGDFLAVFGLLVAVTGLFV